MIFGDEGQTVLESGSGDEAIGKIGDFSARHVEHLGGSVGFKWEYA